jgi:hypothetical protein
MSTDAITKCFRRAIDQTVAGFGDWCVTLTSPRDQSRWIQVTWEHLNLAFPDGVDLDGAIRVFPTVPDLEMIDVQPGTHLTFSHGTDFSLPAISAFVLKYSEVVMKEPIDETWIMTEEQL